ncbi:MAG: hypothetical protein R6V08_07265 [Desulfuromonadales bacterium]
MKSLKPFQYKDTWLAFFVLGIIMLNYPFLVIFNKTTPVLGVPLLYLYFLIGWPLSIFIIFLFSRHIFSAHNGTIEQDHPDESSESDESDESGDGE